MKNKMVIFSSIFMLSFFSTTSYSSCASVSQCPSVIPSTLGENINDHGAVPGDQNDDSHAIACALEMARTNSKKVIIPAGEYDVDMNICLNNNYYNFVQIEGVGWQSVIKHRGGEYAFRVGDGLNTDPASVIFRDFRISAVSNSSAYGAIIYDNAHRALIDHLRIDGYGNPAVGPAAHGLSAIGGAAISYRNTWIHTVKDTMITGAHNGIYARGGSGWGVINAINIENSDFEGVFNGIVLGDNASINIQNNTIEGNNMNKAVTCHAACKSLNVTGNYFEYHGSNPAQVVFVGNSSNSGIVIAQNFAALDSTDSYFEVRNARGVEIYGNTLVHAPNAGEAYIKLGGNGTTVAYFEINNNFAGTSNTTEPDWSSVNYDYVQFVDAATGNPTSYNGRFGTLFDNKTKTLFLGRDTALGVLPDPN